MVDGQDKERAPHPNPLPRAERENRLGRWVHLVKVRAGLALVLMGGGTFAWEADAGEVQSGPMQSAERKVRSVPSEE